MKKASRGQLTVASCLGLFCSGLAISLIGSSLDFFAARLGADVTEVGGSFFIAIGMAAISVQFTAGPLIDRYGKKLILTAGSTLLGLSMALLLAANNLAQAAGAMFVLGAGAGSLSGAINTLINDDLFPDNPGPPLNLVNISFGAGAVSLPFAVGALVEQLGFPALILLITASCVLPVVLFGIGTYPPPREGARFRLAESGRALSDPLALTIACCFFLYVGLESCLGAWSRPTVKTLWGVDTPYDQWILAGYWGSLALGRTVAGTLLRRIPSQTVVIWSCFGACLGLTGFAFAPGLRTACVSLWLTGFCFAPVFPSSLGATGAIFKRYTGTVFSIVIAAGTLGQTIITPSVGRLARSFSFESGMRVALVLCLVLTLLQLSVAAQIRRRIATVKPDAI
jgi:fucose permease